MYMPLKPLQDGSCGRGLGLVGLDSGHSTTCLVVVRHIEDWLNWLCRWATWWNIQIKVNPTQVHDHELHPVEGEG